MAIPIFKLATIGLLPSPLKKAYYRFRGAKIGKRVSFSLLSVLNCDDIEIGDDVKVGMLCFVNAKKLRMGNRSEIRTTAAIDTIELELGSDSIIMEQVVVGGMMTPQSKLVVGKRVKIFPYSFLNTTKEIYIEDDVGVGGSNYIFTHGTWPSALDGYPYSFGPVTIKKGTWLPWRVFVMPNVTIGENSIVAAGSVVTKNIPDRALAGGAPAKILREDGSFIRSLTDKKKRALLLSIMQEFVEHHAFLGSESSISSSDESLEIKLNSETIVFLFDAAKPATSYELSQCKVIVSLNAISEDERLLCTRQGAAWFDIENKETVLSDNVEWGLVREYLGRYGIRFNVIGEEF